MRLLPLPSALLGLAALGALITAVAATHTNNWSVLVCTSRFWFNYRHLANVLSLYRTVKRLGIPDSQIILMLPDDMACNPRNSFPGSVFNDKSRDLDLYDDKGALERLGMGGIEVDYRGNEVTVENFIRLLTDRWPASHPHSKRLRTSSTSNILIYMTGHGGNEFLKFQDSEEINSFDLADAFEQMHQKRRYHELLFMIDTCQANTMYHALYSPGIIATGSSAKDQSSYSHHADQDVGVAVIDRWTYFNLEFLETHLNSTSADVRLGDLFDYQTRERVHSDAGVRYDLFPGGEPAARHRRVLDFFGNVQGVEVEATAHHHDWEADLEAWHALIDEVQQNLVHDGEWDPVPLEGSQSEAAWSPPPSMPPPLRRAEEARGALDMVPRGDGWARKAAGAASLAVLGGAWLVSGALGRRGTAEAAIK